MTRRPKVEENAEIKRLTDEFLNGGGKVRHAFEVGERGNNSVWLNSKRKLKK